MIHFALSGGIAVLGLKAAAWLNQGTSNRRTHGGSGLGSCRGLSCLIDLHLNDSLPSIPGVEGLEYVEALSAPVALGLPVVVMTMG
jgi:hypothetical protein